MVSSREFPLVSLSGQYSSCYYRNGTNFLELRKAEVQLLRILILRTRVNIPFELVSHGDDDLSSSVSFFQIPDGLRDLA